MINSNNDNYSETDKIFTDEHINSDDPNKTASDSEITINSIEHHLSDSITSVENLNVKSCDCITRLKSLKDEFNLKAINIKRNLVLIIENLNNVFTSIRKDIEPTFDKNLTESINQQEGENEKLNNKIKLLETEKKILKDDIATKQKLIDRQEEIPAKPGMSKANKLPLKKHPSRVIQPIETKNHYSPLGTKESPIEKKNTRTEQKPSRAKT